MTKVGGGLPDRRGGEGVLGTQRQEVVKTLPFPPLYKTTLIHTLHHTLHSLPFIIPFTPFNLYHFYFSFIRPSLPSLYHTLQPLALLLFLHPAITPFSSPIPLLPSPHSLHSLPFATFPSTLPFATFSSLPSLSHIPFTPFPPPHSLHSLPFTTFPSQFTTFHSLSSFPQIPFINTLHSLILTTFPSPHYPFLSDPSSIFLPIFPLSIYTTPLPLCPPFFLTPPPSNSFFHSIILELLCHTA